MIVCYTKIYRRFQNNNIIQHVHHILTIFAIIGEFLIDLKQEFSGGDNKTIKVAELKKIEQESKTIEKFIQKFKRAAKRNEYERRLLIEKFKRGINRIIQRKLIRVEHPSRSIEQQYKRITNLNRHWKKSRREEKRLKEKRKTGNQALKLNMPANAGKTQK